MICSFNEVFNLLRKACVGAGIDVGLASDLAKAGAELCVEGVDGVAIVLDAVEANIGISWPAIIELAVATEVSQTCVDGAKAIELLKALCFVAAREHKVAFSVVTKGDNIEVTCGGPNSVRDGTDVSTDVARYAGGVELSDASIERATKLSMLTYVPASDESRLSGAGAGLTDND